MSVSESQQGGATNMEFHPDFAIKRAGDVILKADDTETPHFYYQLSRLAHLSTFFADLPPPSSIDLIGDTTIISLPDTSTAGLALFLHAINSLTSPGPFRFLGSPPEAVLNAALIGHRFETPLICRLLVEKESHSPDLPPGWNLVTIFALWALSGVESHIAKAAEATALYSGFDITQTPKHTVRILQQYAPSSWMKLQALHLRRAGAPYRFMRECRLQLTHCCCETCSRVGVDLHEETRDRISKAQTTRGMKALVESGYGVECADCRIEVVSAC